MSDAGAPRGRWSRRALVIGLTLAGICVLALGAWFGWRAWAGARGRADGASGAPVVLAPGERPFDRREQAFYRITWKVDAGSGLAAGRLAFEAAGSAAARHLVLDVETAAWAAAFYDLHGRIESWTDGDLRPSRQELHLREGRRTTDRTTRFDGTGRTSTVNDAAPLGLPEGARDGLSAWYHVRTLPLAPGYRLRMPIVENGRVFELSGEVERVERVAFGPRQVEAFRLSLRLSAGRGDDLIGDATAWVSTDSRRIPLAIDLSTRLGPFRAELDRYERK